MTDESIRRRGAPGCDRPAAWFIFVHVGPQFDQRRHRRHPSATEMTDRFRRHDDIGLQGTSFDWQRSTQYLDPTAG